MYIYTVIYLSKYPIILNLGKNHAFLFNLHCSPGTTNFFKKTCYCIKLWTANINHIVFQLTNLVPRACALVITSVPQ